MSCRKYHIHSYHISYSLTMPPTGEPHQSRQERRQQERDRIRAQGGNPDHSKKGSRPRAANKERSIVRGGSSAAAAAGPAPPPRPPFPDPRSETFHDDLSDMLEARVIDLDRRDGDPSLCSGENRQRCVNTQKERLRLSLSSMIAISHDIMDGEREMSAQFRASMAQGRQERCVDVSEVRGQAPLVYKTQDESLLADMVENEGAIGRLIDGWELTLKNFDESMSHIDQVRRREGRLLADPMVARMALSWESLRKQIWASIQHMRGVKEELREFIAALQRGQDTKPARVFRRVARRVGKPENVGASIESERERSRIEQETRRGASESRER